MKMESVLSYEKSRFFKQSCEEKPPRNLIFRALFGIIFSGLNHEAVFFYKVNDLIEKCCRWKIVVNIENLYIDGDMPNLPN